MKPPTSCASCLKVSPLLFPVTDLPADTADVDVRDVYSEPILIENGNDVLPIRMQIVQGTLVDTKLPFRFFAKFCEARPLKAIGNGGVFVRSYEYVL